MKYIVIYSHRFHPSKRLIAEWNQQMLDIALTNTWVIFDMNVIELTDSVWEDIKYPALRQGAKE